jgi:benzoate transport
MMTAEDPRSIIAERPMTTFQIVIIAMMFCLNALDGYDVLVISFAAPGVVHDWGLTNNKVLSSVIAIGLFANAAGSLFFAPIADRIGRRPMIFISLITMTIGMFVSALATGVVSLSAARLLTGVGVGALVPTISAMSAEYSNRRYRGFGVIIMAIGFPMGGLVGGQIAALLLQHFSWRSVFVAGGIASALMLLAPLRRVPESIEYLLAKRPANALDQINAILRRMGHPGVTSLPVAADATRQRSTLATAAIIMTGIITLSYALHNSTLYYALNWIPKILVDQHFTASQGASVAAWCSGGGTLGSLLAAYLSTFIPIRPLTIGALFATALALCLFAHTPGDLTYLTAASLLLGACVYGAQVSLYALMTISFPVQLRASGVGVVTGVGRLGGIISPLVAGALLDVGQTYPQVSMVMALGSTLGAVTLLVSGRLLATARTPVPASN